MNSISSIAARLGITRSNISMAQEAMLTVDLFRRRFTIWKPEMMVMPPTPLVTQFQFPAGSVYHFVATDGIQHGPSASDVRLTSIDKKMPIEVIRHLASFEGKPRTLAINIQGQIDAWHRFNKRFRKARNAVAEAPNEQTLAICNYAFLPQLYAYTRSIYTDRYRWHNTWNTVLTKINDITRESNRLNFIFLEAPQQLPSMQRMQNLDGKADNVVIRALATSDDWMLYELWKWVDPARRANSLFNRLDPAKLHQVRIVIQDSGRFMCLDLGLLHDWVLRPDTTPEQKIKLKPVDLQKRLLRSFMALMQNRSPVVLDENTGEIDEAATNAQQDQNTPAGDNVADNESASERMQRLLDELDEDMEQLDSNDAERMKNEEEQEETTASPVVRAATPVANFDEPKTVDQSIMAQADALDNMGVLAPSEYRKIVKLVEKTKELKNPYGGHQTLVEFGSVHHEETKIKQVPQVPDSHTLIDKSMRDASLKDVDSHYVNHFLKRDTVGSVLAMQKAGIIVTNHEVETQESVLGKYELHSVRIAPLVGLPTTLRFKLPVPDESGKIKNGGTEYRYRRQRIDLPIRKISASRVALSSYYGKSFVSRSERSTYDYGKWLQREVTLLAIGDQPSITNVKTGDVYDRTCKAGRAYTSLSERYRAFTFDGIDFQFEYALQKNVFSEQALETAATHGLTLCGLKDQVAYALDENNTLYSVEPGNATPIENFETFLGIEASRAPLEFTECRIFGKNIPTGVVLAYYYGLQKLIEMLGAGVRRVNAGQRQNLQTNEWSLAFEDETLIFNRDDKLATLILAGFKSVEKSTKRYSVHAFDKQAVYLNVLEQQGLSVRYLRELDSIDKLFVDPITERVLIRMKEPITYRGLIKRASEMLLLDEHPRMLDARYMRWRGMERIAGNVYTEMVQTLREHNASANRANTHMKMNVYGVWKRVMQDDPAMTQVKDINPINDLKEVEAVTYAGTGGRTSRSMTRSSRYYDPTDMGVISEATSDSKDVAINTYTSASPRFDSLEGMIKDPLFAETPATNLLSTSALVSPSAV